MGGGGGGDGGAAQREKERQTRIAQGYEEIRKIFEGYSKGVGDVATPELGASYYTADGRQIQISPMQFANPDYQIYMQSGKGSGSLYRHGRVPDRYISVPGYELDGQIYTLDSPPIYPAAQKGLFPSSGTDQGAKKSGQLFSGKVDVPGFDDNFYNQRAQNYMQFAMPQLEDQYSKAQEQLMYALARTGRLQSTTRGNRFADLQQDYDIQKTNVADKAQGYAADARSNVERARADLVALNNSVADPTAIAQQAQLSSNVMRSAPAFDPLAPLFQNVTEGIATQAELERRNASRYNTGFFAPSLNGGSGRVVRG